MFLCGETELAGKLALLFALYHRHSYTGCKAALSEIFTGATALAADYNGIAKAQHVRHKLADMTQIVDLIFAAGIAAAMNAVKTDSGTYVPDTNYCNAGRMLAGEAIYGEYEALAAIAGGLAATLPSEAEFANEKTGPYMEKYIMRDPDVSPENQHRAFRLFQDMMASTWGGHKLIDALHGGGSPVIEKVAIYRDADLERSKNIAKKLGGIPYEGTTKKTDQEIPLAVNDLSMAIDKDVYLTVAWQIRSLMQRISIDTHSGPALPPPCSAGPWPTIMPKNRKRNFLFCARTTCTATILATPSKMA